MHLLAMVLSTALETSTPQTSPVATTTPIVQKHKFNFMRILRGMASWYGLSWTGSKTASGVRLNNSEHMCAMRYTPFNTIVHIKNLSNGLTSWCKVVDRGPFVSGRVIDLTYIVKQEIGMSGLAPVTVSW